MSRLSKGAVLLAAAFAPCAWFAAQKAAGICRGLPRVRSQPFRDGRPLPSVARTPEILSSIATSGPFAVASNTCGASVLTGKNCTVGITFSPTAFGSGAGTLTFTDDAVTDPQNVSLSGTARRSPRVNSTP